MSAYEPPPRTPKCTICWHPDRQAIEQQIINGKPLRQIAIQWGWSYTNGKTGKVEGDHKRVSLHRDKCMAADYAYATGADKAETGFAIQARLDELDRHIDTVLKRRLAGHPVEVEGVALLNEDGSPQLVYDDRLILLAVREARRNLDARWRFASGLPEPDKDSMEQARQAMADPEVRRLLQTVEETLARHASG